MKHPTAYVQVMVPPIPTQARIICHAAELTADDELKKGIIHTEIEASLARMICVVFALTICAVPLSQTIIEIAHGQRPQVFDVFRHSPSKSNFSRFEEELTRASFARQFVQPRVQAFESMCMGFGNSKAILGRDGWVFYEPGISYVGGPGILENSRLHPPRGKLTESDTRGEQHPDPRPAILQFNQQCKEAGVRLILVPIPDKAMIQPAELSARFGSTENESINNPDYVRLISELREQGVDIFDASLADSVSGNARFLKCDTHWTPEWMSAVAKKLAQHISDENVGSRRSALLLHEETATVASAGDLVQMLKLASEQQIFPAQEVEIRRVVDNNRQSWQTSRDAAVLVLGDSFSNIYSLDSMGWGDSAGFVEHLSLALNRPLDRITRNDAGAFATREMLSRELAQGRNRLAGKKVLVWEFAMRELTAGNWKMLSMSVEAPKPRKFIVPLPQTTMVVSATVAAAARAPRPGSVPYKDHIIAIHLVDVENAASSSKGDEAIVYMWSMRNNQLTAAARYREGDKVRLCLSPWSESEKKLGSINRAELADDDLLLEEPCWGDAVAP